MGVTVELPPLVGDGVAVPGSPSAEALAAASGAVRAWCGWHVAPVVTHELVLDSDGGTVLHLPTLALHEVLEVTDLSGPEPVPVTDFRSSVAGMLSRPAGWPDGFGTVRVRFRHGFDRLPEGLVPVLGAVAVRRVKREQLGSRSRELDDYEGQLHDRVLARFALEGLP